MEIIRILIIITSLFFLKVQFGKCDTNFKNFKFYQNDYKIEISRGEVTKYNPDYVNYFKITTFKFNRTCTAFNVSFNFKVPLGREVQAVVQTYKFASNEYRLFPIRFQLNFCDAIYEDVAGMRGFLKNGNFSGCPIENGKRFEIHNFTPDPSRFPPLIPDGQYMNVVQGVYKSAEIWTFQMYGEISRPFV